MENEDNNSTSLLSGSELKLAIAEANRCLNCKSPKCKMGCPISNDIPEFIAALAQGDLGEAGKVIFRKSNLPAVCGRVCAHEQQCEGHCVLNKTGKPIRVGMLEKTIADFAFEMDLPMDKIQPKTKGKVAVIGSGPAGLTVAGDLAKEGFAVTIFEALEEPGGVLLYGIPSFRISKKIIRREIDRIKMLGVQIITNSTAGVDFTVDQLLREGYDAVFIGTGTSIAKDLDLPGRELEGIFQSSYLLRMGYLHRSGHISRNEVPILQGDRVLVIGAGNTAMDASRTAKRLGAESVTIICRSTKEEMPALHAEYEGSLADGVDFLFETSPIEFTGDGNKLTGLMVSDSQGVHVIPADKILLAVGSRPANRIVSTTKGIEVDNDGYVKIKERPYGMTTLKSVFAGGDVVHRPATVVLAMKEAKKVAQGIGEYVNAIKLLEL